MASTFLVLAILCGIFGAAYAADGERTGRADLSKRGGGLLCFAAAFLVAALLLTIAGVLGK